MMKKAILMCCFCWVFASEDMVNDRYRPRNLELSQEGIELLLESQQQLQSDDKPLRLQGATMVEGGSLASGDARALENGASKDQKSAKQKKKNKNNVVSRKNIDPAEVQQKVLILNAERAKQLQAENQEKEPDSDPAPQVKKKTNQKAEKKWVYGTAVLTTTFLDGSIKRGYGILLKDGIYLTSANMVYNSAFYTRTIDAMMQDESAAPFVCIAKLSIKALDLQRGLAILEISNYTDAYCNPRPRNLFHQRIQEQYWIDVFNSPDTKLPKGIYTPYITTINSFMAQKVDLGSEKIEDFIKKPTKDFELQTHPYGKGFYTQDGKLLGVIASDKNNLPKWIKNQEITEFLCELSEKKIIETPYLQSKCQQTKK